MELPETKTKIQTTHVGPHEHLASPITAWTYGSSKDLRNTLGSRWEWKNATNILVAKTITWLTEQGQATSTAPQLG